MFSRHWYETFADTVQPALAETELAGITRLLPLNEFRRVLDVGCGVGRVAGPLASLGYDVIGLDINVDALRRGRRDAPHVRFVALDQRHAGRMRWRFDAAILLWHSLGFGSRDDDLATLAGLAAIVRPGGRVALELFHPGWMAQHALRGQPDPRGAAVRRWMEDGRCRHEITYPGGHVDRIEFTVYQPDEIWTLAERAGLAPERLMVWWDPARSPGADAARYQLVCGLASAANPAKISVSARSG
jgi:SAM-dependent methyltransferase